ncbi:MAG: 1,2-phenylacetyl-CoA epoxidase subunit PaaD [Gemmatirosa sp.]
MGTPPSASPVGSQPLTREAVWAALEEVPDPEVPVISVVELGIVRDVEFDGDAVTVVITPTYSGCPAMHEIERDVLAALHARGWRGARIRTVHAPAWTTDWMTDAAREKLRAYGIAPPGAGGGRAAAEGLVTLRRRGAAPAAVPCPFCGSGDTALRSAFGSTACKALHFCNACHQPFEEFKPI